MKLESKAESGIGNRTKLESNLESGIERSWNPKRNRESEVELSWNPKRNPESGSQLTLGIGVPFLTWFRNRVSKPGPVLRNSDYKVNLIFRMVYSSRIHEDHIGTML